MRAGKRVLLLLVLGLCVCSLTAQAEPSLEQLRADIKQLAESIDANLKKKSQNFDQLRLHDLRIAKLSQVSRQLEQKLTANRKSMERNQVRQTELRRLSTHNRRQLANHLRGLYRVGNQNLLRTLFSVQDAASLSRQLSYYSYFSQARIEQLKQARESQRSLREIGEKLEQDQQNLSRLQSQKQSELERLNRAKLQRTAFLQQLNQTLTQQQSRLQRLQEDLARLEDLLQDLDHAPENPPPAPRKRQSFATLKGELSWPINGGRIIQAYGKKSAGTTRHGIIISAAEEQAVFPVAEGKVLYADWLRGFGMLLIIDHGGQYMSLYGHNTALYCEKGDWVEPLQQIASAGKSGGSDEVGLYFELRYRGKPINPRRWFRR